MRIVHWLLLLSSWVYGLVVVVRNWCYDVGLFGVEHASVPVVSVGNMVAGGTGKTPFVEYLVRYFQKRGKRVAVLSRGYKRSTSGMQVVSDGKTIVDSASTVGDEPFQLAQKFPGAVVVVDEKRVRAARFVVEKFGPDVILLDDGFQHRALARNLDVVMINGQKPLAEVPMLPAGLRREPIRSLRRASMLAIVHARDIRQTTNDLTRFTSAPPVDVRFVPKQLHPFCSGAPLPLSMISGKQCIAFCGIGNPSAFWETLLSIGVGLQDSVVYPDHHWYSDDDLKEIQQKFEYWNAEIVVTTEKDAARLRSRDIPAIFPVNSLYVLEIEAIVVRGESLLHGVLNRTTSLKAR